MSIFFIWSIACMTRFDFWGSLSSSILVKAEGTTCQDRPNLSFSQPHCDSWPPAVSLLQNSSTSFCVSLLAWHRGAPLMTILSRRLEAEDCSLPFDTRFAGIRSAVWRHALTRDASKAGRVPSA